MANKTITAVISDAMFAEAFVQTPGGEEFVGSIELQIRDIESDDIYIKKLTEADLCEISGIDKSFSALEIIKIAEHIRRFTQPIELVVDDQTHLISNAMITGQNANVASRPNSEPEVKSTQNRQRPATKNFGFNPQEAMESRKRKTNPRS